MCWKLDGNMRPLKKSTWNFIQLCVLSLNHVTSASAISKLSRTSEVSAIWIGFSSLYVCKNVRNDFFFPFDDPNISSSFPFYLCADICPKKVFLRRNQFHTSYKHRFRKWTFIISNTYNVISNMYSKLVCIFIEVRIYRVKTINF